MENGRALRRIAEEESTYWSADLDRAHAVRTKEFVSRVLVFSRTLEVLSAIEQVDGE